jgi:hypothetical protein
MSLSLPPRKAPDACCAVRRREPDDAEQRLSVTKKTDPRTKKGGARREPAKERIRTGTGENHFDTWLDEKLRTAYSSVLDEPIPDDLLRLLQQRLKD